MRSSSVRLARRRLAWGWEVFACEVGPSEATSRAGGETVWLLEKR